MARRAQVQGIDQGSQKENAGGKAKLKKESVKKEKWNKARVVVDEEDELAEPGATQGNGVANGDVDSDNGKGDSEDVEKDELKDDDDEAEGGAGTPKGRKRARINADGQSVAVKNEVNGKGKARTTTLPRDDDGYIPGSIVRIQLKNFVTYDWVEFRPGPYLNMILGPNGTGKSSIACAICLGLNWPPSVLGRASELGSFVKIGAETGHIEIELKGAKGKPNLVIRRNLKAKSKSSTFTLNGTSAPGREITERMAELNVQVGNLCSFLPQDKVSEFAAMSSQQLLRETQRAAGDENLTNWHDTLISSGKELKTMQDLVASERGQLKTMEERNAILERDVERYNERRAIEHKIEMLEILIPIQTYREMRARFLEMKAQQRALHEQVARLRDKNAPLHAHLKKLSDQHKEYNDAREAKKKTTKQRFDKMRSKWSQSERWDTVAEELTLKIEDIKKNEKNRAKRIKVLQNEIARMTSELETPLQTESMQVVNDEIKQLNFENQDVVNRQDELQQRQKANIEDTSRHKVEIDARLGELRNLDDINVRKLQELARWDKDCHDAIVWLRQNSNRSKFRMEVFEPPLVCLTVPDTKYARAVESCFNSNQLRTFVVQCPEDLKTLNHCINDLEGLGRKARINTWYRPKHESGILAPPMTPEELAALGFDGYAIQYVSCPDGLLWYLKAELNMHRTAVGLDAQKVDVAQATQAVSRLGPNNEGGGANFIVGTTLNSVQRSKYGRRAAQNMTREIRPARNFVNSTVDPEVKKRIDAKIVEARNALRVLEEQSAELTKKDKEIQAEAAEYKKKFDALNARRKAITDAGKNRATLTGKLTRSKDNLKREQEHESAEDERAKLQKDLLNTTKKRVKIAKEYIELITGVMKDQADATRVGLKFLQVGANKAALEELSKVKDAAYNDALVAFNKVDKAYNEIKEESRQVLEESREKVFGSDPVLRAEYEVIEQRRTEYDNECKKAEKDGATPPSSEGVELRSTEELRTELDTQQANLEMNLNTNPGVVEQYEKRKKEIEELSGTIEVREKKCLRIERGIKVARDNWQPALEKLVGSIGEKFSAAFDRIGCAGEVRISEHDDYDKWAIDILVKFRNQEKLQILTAQRQSGGERSLTTILYLMSLTEEARAPFSLVDEINQGMDQRAERNVHDSMVEVTCKPDSAQYFLITPKLLTDLKYHERMKILCVNNGEWLPEEKDVGNMMGMIEAVVRRRELEKANPQA